MKSIIVWLFLENLRTDAADYPTQRVGVGDNSLLCDEDNKSSLIFSDYFSDQALSKNDTLETVV